MLANTGAVIASAVDWTAYRPSRLNYCAFNPCKRAQACLGFLEATRKFVVGQSRVKKIDNTRATGIPFFPLYPDRLHARMKPLTSTVARRFIAARLSPEGWLGLHLTIGLIALLLTGWLFAEIAEDVVNGDKITLIDVQLATWFHAHATPFFTGAMLALTHMHGTTGILLMALLAGVYLKRMGERYWLMTLVFAVVGGVVLNVLLKHIFQRARPLFDVPLLTLDTYSFPSGHVAGSTALYGVLAAFLLSRPSSGMTKVFVVAGACMMVVLVGLSRMYLGVHYLSDVMAAMMSASAWLALCITGVSTLRRHRLQGTAT